MISFGNYKSDDRDIQTRPGGDVQAEQGELGTDTIRHDGGRKPPAVGGTVDEGQKTKAGVNRHPTGLGAAGAGVPGAKHRPDLFHMPDEDEIEELNMSVTEILRADREEETINIIKNKLF